MKSVLMLIFSFFFGDMFGKHIDFSFTPQGSAAKSVAGNSGMDALYPEFWAGAFDELDKGQYNFQNMVSRKYEEKLGNMGDTVNVPLAPDVTDAEDWAPGGAITATAISQETVSVILNQSKRKTFALTGTELSLSPYDLMKTYGTPHAEAMLRTLNKAIYEEALKAKYFTHLSAAIDEDDVIDVRTALSNRLVGLNRNFIMAPDESGALLKTDAFQRGDVSMDNEGNMREGIIKRKVGFDFFENNAIEKYTPADLLGAIDNGAGYAAGTTTIVVKDFNDDANPIRPGDIFSIADEVGTPKHTVISTTTTTSDTTGITFYPALIDAVADSQVITVVPTRSAIALTPSAMALAVRPYALLPQGSGVTSTVIMYQGIPFRISIWHDGKLGINIQFDCLFGVKKVKDSRIHRVTIA